MKIGICFGGYCPLTMGHMDVINKARKECDKTFVVVCGYDNEPRATQLGIDLFERFLIIRNFLKDDITSVIHINDTDLGLDESCSLHNWEIWTNAVMEQINDSSNRSHFMPALNNTISKEDITFYVAEVAYVAALSQLGFDVHYIKRELPVSGTAVRNNPIKWWKYITRAFKPYLVHSILVIGTASEGKTTLCRDISKYFDIAWTPEYGREYMDKLHITDADLDLKDFKKFISKQYDTSSTNIIDSASKGNGIMCADTDALITLMYAHAYAERDDMPNFSIDDYNELLDYAQFFINAIKWKHIFVLMPNSEFVDDGTRFMGQSSMDERNKNYEFLMSLVNKYYKNIPITFLKGGEYQNNYETVKQYIANL